ncbi:protein transport protein Sec24A [Diabrotica virgifera virgifera]|uniref:Protein transport protein Sec24A n=1 Tax=Diabrotica virgifera virgifera TaxID=50390 RepID=A0A6P7FB34_DIAVI|nr:protein transport protein Sec24A [Diabrotica virgifera virgifera]XP_050501056.1 protein transport protein Sec24A [Diabrotica virgifera virgifera]
MADRNVNGISPNPETLKHNAIYEEKLHQQFNGVHSSQSSRSSSPGTRLGYVPPSQLPPSRPIPQSQLPPSRSAPGNITQQFGALNLNQNAPRHSPQFGAPATQPTSSSPYTIPPFSQVSKESINSQSSAILPPTSNTSSTVTSSQMSTPLQQGPFSAQPTSGFQKPDPFQAIKPAQTNNTQPTSNVNNQPSQNPMQFNQNSPNVRLQPNQVPVQNNMGVPTNSNMPRISPVPPQQNFQPSPNRSAFGPIPPPGIQNPIVSQISPNRTGLVQGPPLQTQYRAPNQIPGPPPQAGVLQANQQRSYQASPIQQNNNQRFNNAIATQNINNGPTMNANFPPQAAPSNYPQMNSAPPPQTNVAPKTNVHSNRYPTMQSNSYQQPAPSQYQQQPPSGQYQYQQPMQQPVQQPMNSYPSQNNQQSPYQGVVNTGFNKLWGMEQFDLLQTPNILQPSKVEAPQIRLGQDLLDQANCSPDVFRCTMTKIPENNSLLQKSRLPLGVLIHPFRDLSHLPVIQCSVIVRCRACRTYINPFVLFVDNKRWKCNLCYRINELPEEFQYDPMTKTYGDPSRRPEIKSSTLEYIAPAEYMLRPPQPAVYLYLLDVSRLAMESGYLNIVCSILLEELKNLPGDARTQIGFIAYNSALHFYSLPEGITQPHEMTILDIDDIFLPTPDNLLVNLKDRMDLIADLLRLLPNRFANTFDTNSALGAALQVAFKMMGATGGRVTVFQASLPNIGPGALISREDPSNRASAEVAHLNPANDFYKRLALECSGQQIAVDLFVVNSQYVDIATISGISRFSGGCMHHFPLLKPTKPVVCDRFARSFRRYITRKIGFEAVMRLRCTRGLSIHTFHGNFFVRSTDLLSLPNINPDAGFGMQVAIEESLSDVQTVCFQAALLYTSSKGERRIRVHTMCLPVATTIQDVIHSADQQCIIGLLSKMAVDRSMQSSLSDAREAFINVAIDILSSFKMSLNMGSPVTGLLVPNCMRILPLYISALLKHLAFRTGSSTRLDDRVMKMIEMKTKPLYMLIQDIYPDLFPIHNLEHQEVIMNSEEEPVSMPPRLQLTARCLENKGAFLLDTGEHMIILVCPNVPQEFLTEALGVSQYSAIPDDMYEIPVLDNLRNQRLHQFITYLNEEKPYPATLQVIRDNSTNRVVFFERLIEDRVEDALSYHEFLQHLKTQVK